MASWAKPGVKCVCVHSVASGSHGDGVLEGSVYTVRDVTTGAPNGKVGIHLNEAITTNVYGYWVGRFRSLITKTQEQDIALFKHHLIENNARTDA